jgi:hypothetical protein
MDGYAVNRYRILRVVAIITTLILDYLFKHFHFINFSIFHFYFLQFLFCSAWFISRSTYLLLLVLASLANLISDSLTSGGKDIGYFLRNRSIGKTPFLVYYTLGGVYRQAV